MVMPLCGACRHLDLAAPKGSPQCAAFPEGIPTPILLMRKDHRKPIHGDHGIRFSGIEQKATKATKKT